MEASASALHPTEPFGPALAQAEESSTDVGSGYQDAPADAAREAGGDEGETRLSPNEGEVPRQSFADQLAQRGEA
jgi:hypothetical protein